MTALFLFLILFQGTLCANQLTEVALTLHDEFIRKTQPILQQVGVSKDETHRMLHQTFTAQPEQTQHVTPAKKSARSHKKIGISPNDIFDQTVQQEAFKTLVENTSLSTIIAPAMIANAPHIGLWCAAVLASQVLENDHLNDAIDTHSEDFQKSIQILQKNASHGRVIDDLLGRIDETNDVSAALTQIKAHHTLPSPRTQQSFDAATSLMAPHGLSESDHKHLAWATWAKKSMDTSIPLYARQHEELSTARLAFTNPVPMEAGPSQKKMMRRTSKSQTYLPDDPKTNDARSRAQQIIDAINTHLDPTNPQRGQKHDPTLRSLRTIEDNPTATPDEHIDAFPAMVSRSILDRNPTVDQHFLIEATLGLILQDGLRFYVSATRHIRLDKPLTAQFIRNVFKDYDEPRILATMNTLLTTISANEPAPSLNKYLLTDPENQTLELLATVLTHYFNKRFRHTELLGELLVDKAEAASLALDYLLETSPNR